MTNNTAFYFKSYQEWHHAITKRCNIKLTKAYARERISALQNSGDPTTQEFIATYGNAYADQVIQWFEQAERSAD